MLGVAKLFLHCLHAMSLSPSVDEFAEVLSADSHWYVLGTFLGVPCGDLDHINHNFRLEGVKICLIKVYTCLERKQKLPTWDMIATALKRAGNIALANKIESTYKNAPLHRDASSSSSQATTAISSTESQSVSQSVTIKSVMHDCM